MNIFFRADASVQIGTGHVMRCLTLANALKKQGGQCSFICREHHGNLIEYIECQGFFVFRLPKKSTMSVQDSALGYLTWLGVTQEEDAKETINLINKQKIDWLVVDNYALNEIWEKQLRLHTQKIMVIDDLADRRHDCDLLLDQNLVHTKGDYQNLVPENCQILIGVKYALLRPEFAKWREYSLKRRQVGGLKKVLISFGGVDKDNNTSKILKALKHGNIPSEIQFIVVMGIASPYLEEVKTLTAQISNPTQIMVNVNNMAELMANSDLAIGAAGSTSWERCCLGLPTLMMILADNQKGIAQTLSAMRCAISMTNDKEICNHIKILYKNKEQLAYISSKASQAVQGYGTEQVINVLTKDMYGLRPMQLEDLSMVRDWRNHPDVRNYMFQQNEISEKEHLVWFSYKKQESDRYLLIFEKKTEPLGFLNLKVNQDNKIEWGFYLAPHAQGGMGKIFGNIAVKYCFEMLAAKEIYAEVLSENIRSQKFHEQLGFKLINKKGSTYYYLLQDTYFIKESS